MPDWPCHVAWTAICWCNSVLNRFITLRGYTCVRQNRNTKVGTRDNTRVYLQIFPGPLYITSAIITFNSVFFVSHRCRASVILSIYIHSLFLGPAVYRSLRNRRTHAHTHIYTTRASLCGYIRQLSKRFRWSSPIVNCIRHAHRARGAFIILYFVSLSLYYCISTSPVVAARRGLKRFLNSVTEDDTNSKYIYRKIELYNL